MEYIGAGQSVGTFVDGPFGMTEGIAISTGLVEEMAFTDPRVAPSTDMGQPGHPFCVELSGSTSVSDAAVLRIEFDLDPAFQGILFDFVVGTEEYPEYVADQFNDAFGIFVNGVNVGRDLSGEPITVNGPFFNSGDVLEYPQTESNFGGSTPRYTGRANNTTATGNELLIVVCDTADSIFDTGAFLSGLQECTGNCEGTSFCGDGVLQTPEICDGELLAASVQDCPDGYEGTPLCNNNPANPNGDGTCSIDPIPDGCEDIDECTVFQGICGAGDCENLPGSYSCDCDSGYEFDADLGTCVDVDECQDVALNDCDGNATCFNLPGTFECTCNPGFAGDGVTCLIAITLSSPAADLLTNDPRPEISGAGEPGETVTIRVNGNEVTTVTIGGDGQWSYTPDEDLPEGDVLITVTDGISSAEVEIEIDTIPPMVDILTPAADQIFATSPEEFSGEAEPGAEIEIFLDGQLLGSTVADGDGNWEFEVNMLLEDGFYELRARATDAAGNSADETQNFAVNAVDECLATPGVCGAGECQDLPGGYACDCDAGYEFDVTEGTCVDIDECLDSALNNCDGNADCANLPGTFECTCNLGFAGDGVNCIIELTLSSPEEDLLTNDPRPEISGTGEPGETVTISVNGVEIATVTIGGDGQWTHTPEENLPEGDVVISVTDGVTTVAVEIEVDTIAPMVQILSPQADEAFTSSPDEFSGEAEPFAQIDIYLDGEYLGTTTADGDGEWSFELDDPLDDGLYEVVVRATDAAGNQAEVSRGFVVDSTAPVVITSPSEGAVVRTAQPTVSGTAEPDSEVEILIDGDVVAVVTTDDEGTFIWTPDDALPEGELTVTARRDSPAGDREDSVTFEIDTSTTAVTIDQPQDGVGINNTRPTFSGSAAPGAEVTIFVNGEAVDTVTADGNGNWSWTPDDAFEEGEQEITVLADDDQIITEATIEITIDVTPPQLVVSEPVQDGEVPAEGGQVTGTGEPGAVVEVFIDDELVGTTVIDENGEWSVDLPDDLEPGGSYDLTVTARDEAGNTTVVERAFVVEGADEIGGGGTGDGDGDGDGAGDGDADGIADGIGDGDDGVDLDGGLSGGGVGCATTEGSPMSTLLIALALGLFALRRRLRPSREFRRSALAELS